MNPDMFQWARETAGLSLDEAASLLDMPTPAELQGFESGVMKPDPRLLERFSHLYRRPLLTFYLERPPPADDHGIDFRAPAIDRKTRGREDADVRDIFVRHLLLRDAVSDLEELARLFVGQGDGQCPPGVAAAGIRQAIRFDLRRYRELTRADHCFDYLRRRVESAGIFVLPLPAEFGLRGVAIADPIAPLVVLNVQHDPEDSVHGLLHELIHIWLGQTAVCGPHQPHETEQYCDAVAHELLRPGQGREPFHADAAKRGKLAAAQDVKPYLAHGLPPSKQPAEPSWAIERVVKQALGERILAPLDAAQILAINPIDLGSLLSG